MDGGATQDSAQSSDRPTDSVGILGPRTSVGILQTGTSSGSGSSPGTEGVMIWGKFALVLYADSVPGPRAGERSFAAESNFV